MRRPTFKSFIRSELSVIIQASVRLLFYFTQSCFVVQWDRFLSKVGKLTCYMPLTPHLVLSLGTRPYSVQSSYQHFPLNSHMQYFFRSGTTRMSNLFFAVSIHVSFKQ
jgi:hypothetical protein